MPTFYANEENICVILRGAYLPSVEYERFDSEDGIDHNASFSISSKGRFGFMRNVRVQETVGPHLRTNDWNSVLLFQQGEGEGEVDEDGEEISVYARFYRGDSWTQRVRRISITMDGGS